MDESVITAEETTGYLTIKNESAPEALVWRYPEEKIPLPAYLAVHPREEAVLVKDRCVIHSFPEGLHPLPPEPALTTDQDFDIASCQIYFVRTGSVFPLDFHVNPMLPVEDSADGYTRVPLHCLCNFSVGDAPSLMRYLFMAQADVRYDNAYTLFLRDLLSYHLQDIVEYAFPGIARDTGISPYLFRVLEDRIRSRIQALLRECGLNLHHLYLDSSGWEQFVRENAVRQDKRATTPEGSVGSHTLEDVNREIPEESTSATGGSRKKPLPLPPSEGIFAVGSVIASAGSIAAAAMGKILSGASRKNCFGAAESPARESTPPEIQKLRVSALAPRQFMKGDYSIVNVVLYEEQFRYVVDSLKADGDMQEHRSTVQAASGACIRVSLSSPDLEIQDDVQESRWCGDYLEFGFGIFLPTDYAKHSILFKAQVCINGVPATILTFTAKCASFLEQKLKVIRHDILSAFVSYASADRPEVIRVVQGMQKARPDMRIFFDRSSLQSGEEWEAALYREIDHSDMLVLCWSRSASQSRWVDREWRYALRQKGLECIDPVPLEPTELCPPPKELAGKHFNDILTYLRTTL